MDILTAAEILTSTITESSVEPIDLDYWAGFNTDCYYLCEPETV